jgi:hypothetical protein
MKGERKKRKEIEMTLKWTLTAPPSHRDSSKEIYLSFLQ